MNYEELKPWQISQLVHNQVACDGKFEVTFENHGCQWRYKEGALSGEIFEFTMNEAKAKVKHYTSDINFAWPIILQTCMTIELPDNNLGGVGTNTIYNPRGTDWQCDYDDKDKCLLAAMICFLKMKEPENG